MTSNIYTGQYVNDRVRQASYGRIDIFEGHIDTHEGANIFLTIREDNPEICAERFRKFTEQSTGAFTVYLRARHNMAWTGAEVVKIQVSHELAKLNDSVDVGALVNERVNQILRDREIEEQRRAKDEELERLKQPLNRLVYIAEQLAVRLAPAFEQRNPSGSPLNGTARETASDVNLDELNQAVRELVKKFGYQGLIKLNKFLDDNPQYVDTVKNIAGL